ncbi:cation:proton antiporter [Plebeiibacterium sediminum]|uniref:Cation:proton antiporter n=1 Tax=Plebeiibacterium sediminum TaxID=2992112 RepID=A0AAE3SE23_9BACT|nr:cation:proton antiporter [Plebeiobacterium sediminum]MCW3786043.1 cation:proton antiporter [Plebeiobacterium sediminum]
MIFAAVHIDPLFSKFVILSCIVIVIGFLLRLLKQPYMIAYIIVGIIVGPYGVGFVSDEELISNLGSLGLVLLLFFIGMEIRLPQLLNNWKVSIIGTLMQVFASLLIIWLLSFYFNWSTSQVVMFGFVISLSSTAVIVKILQERDEINSKAGQYALGILIAQDILIVPMLILLGYLGGHRPDKSELIKQIIGGILIIGMIIFLVRKKEIKLPFQKYIQKDHEMQVFIAFSLCFGFSTISAFFQLSAALGAFIAGILISATRSTEWVHNSLSAFKILFVALFFISIGMIIDLNFLKDNLYTIVTLLIVVFILNSIINISMIRFFCKDWKITLYVSALLSQIGEFSFILAATGYQSGIIKEYSYQITISTIALTLLFSPLWINLTKKVTNQFHVFAHKNKTA